MQNYSYHAHTHALNKYDGKNTVSEMIAKAEEIGFSELGITNHLCYHPNIPLSNPMSYRDPGRAVEDYRQIVEEIRTAARRAKIKIYAGFEVDFFPSARWRKDFEKIMSAVKADYYIGSSHYMRNSDESELINPYDVLLHGYPCSSGAIEKYFPLCWDNVVESIKSGYFKFIAHPDLYKIFKLGIGPEWDKAKWRIIDALAEYNQPYELNTSGWNKAGEQHPHTWMLEELGKRNVPVVISDDAHSTAMLGQHFERAENLLQSMNYRARFRF
jgi:histidinol phosphate phosphatase hisJ family